MDEISWCIQHPFAVLARSHTCVLSPALIQEWIAQAQIETDGSIAFQQGIANLQRLLASFIPERTALLANYPNPFNPETWIPYQLATAADSPDSYLCNEWYFWFGTWMSDISLQGFINSGVVQRIGTDAINSVNRSPAVSISIPLQLGTSRQRVRW